MKKQISSILLVACLSTATIVGANSFDSDSRHDKSHRHHRGMMFDNIPNLTDEQKVALESLRAQRKSNRETPRPVREDGIKSLDSTAGDYQQQVEALANAAADRARSKTLKRAEIHAQLQAILTTEQIQALSDSKTKRRGHKHEKKHRAEK